MIQLLQLLGQAAQFLWQNPQWVATLNLAFRDGKQYYDKLSPENKAEVDKIIRWGGEMLLKQALPQVLGEVGEKVMAAVGDQHVAEFARAVLTKGSKIGIEKALKEARTESPVAGLPEEVIPQPFSTDHNMSQENPMESMSEHEHRDLAAKITDFNAVFTPDGTLILQDNSIKNISAIVDLCLNRVTNLQIMGDQWRDFHIEKIRRLQGVISILVVVCEKLTDESLLHISKLSTLQTIDLNMCCSDAISAVGFRQFGRLKQVELIKLPLTWGMKGLVNGVKAELQKLLPNTIIS